jgi:formylglycine-generating enzyme required for sulfatase activity
MSQPPNYRPAPQATKLHARDDEWPPDWLDEKPRPAKRKSQPAPRKRPAFTYKVKDSEKVCSKRLLRGGSWSSQAASALKGGRG